MTIVPSLSLRGVPRGALVVLAALLSLGPNAAQAGNPALARYTHRSDAVFWFLQVTDLHIGAPWPNDEADENLEWLLFEAYDVFQPDFVVVTGDLTDSNLLFGQNEGEWETYRDIARDAGMDAEFYFDPPGNHDHYGDEDFSFYRAYSVQGAATDRLQQSWRRAFPFGAYHFVALNTAASDGAVWPVDNAGLNGDERAFFAEALDAEADARLTFAFGHHPLSQFEESRDETRTLFAEHAVSAYAYGHIHEYTAGFEGATLHLSLDAFGKADSNNLAVWAVDEDNLSVTVGSARQWPLIGVTVPGDVGLAGGNPWATTVPLGVADNPVRTLVFSPDNPYEVLAQVDDGSFAELRPVEGPLWQGAFDSRDLAPGDHDLRIVVVGPTAGERVIRIRVGTTPCSDGVDNDGDGLTDAPADPGCEYPADPSEDDPPAPAEPNPEAGAVEPMADAGATDAPDADAAELLADAGATDAPADTPPTPDGLVDTPPTPDVPDGSADAAPVPDAVDTAGSDGTGDATARPDADPRDAADLPPGPDAALGDAGDSGDKPDAGPQRDGLNPDAGSAEVGRDAQETGSGLLTDQTAPDGVPALDAAPGPHKSASGCAAASGPGSSGLLGVLLLLLGLAAAKRSAIAGRR